MRWYALYVRSNMEKLVALQLEHAGIEAFYPFIIKLSADRRRDFEQKFMPGYVFGRFDLADKTPVVAIPQITRIVGWGRDPVEIPEFEIEAVRKIVSAPKLVMPAPSDYVATGDQVRVLHGPLTGLEGYVVYAKNRTRVVVSVTMLARSISAEVDATTLEILRKAAVAA